jgi:hypothetical protein
MAFSTTIRNQIYPGAGVRMVIGEWSGAAGDSAGTIALGGAYPIMCIFQKLDPLDNSYQIIPRVETSVSNGICTFTIENQDNVTTGRFLIITSGQ